MQYRDAKRVSFEVRLTENDSEVHKTPESLLRALARTGHAVSARVCSRMTSLGKTLCVAQPDGSFVSIPINVPMRSGVKMFDKTDWQVYIYSSGGFGFFGSDIEIHQLDKY